MSLTDEEFTEQISDLVGDIAYALYRLFAQDSRGGSVDRDEQQVKKEWKDITVRFCKLMQDS